MRTKITFLVVGFALLASTTPAQAQQAEKVYRIGFLRTAEPPAANLAAFRQGLHDRGHVEGKTYTLIPGWGKPGGKKEKPAVLARALMDRGVDVIVSVGSSVARAASRTAPEIPIVMATGADPVRAGLIKSLARPGGNITGMSAAAVEFTVKGFELLKQMMPGLYLRPPDLRGRRIRC